MATYKTLILDPDVTPGDPPEGNVVARKLATRLSVHQQQAAQDRILTTTRRVILSLPLGPQPDGFIPDADPATGVNDPIYPDPVTEYTVHRASTVCLTPGALLHARVVALPSGATVVNNGTEMSPDWIAGPAGGAVIVTVTYTHPDTSTTTATRTIEIPPSNLQYAKKPDDDGVLWGMIDVYSASLIPDELMGDATPANEAKWSASLITAEITVKHRGSPRVIDLVVYEQPHRVVRDIETATRHPTHLYTGQGGLPHQGYPHVFPVEETGTTDPRMGMEHTIAVANEQALQLGPTLFCGSAWNQQHDMADVFSTDAYGGDDWGQTGDDETPPISTTATSFHHLLSTDWTTWGTDLPAHSTGCGAYGRHAWTSGTQITPNSGVVDVVLGVYSTTGLGTGDFRLQGKDHAYVTIPIPVAGYAWNLHEGEVPCQTGPEDTPVLTPMVQVESTYTHSVRYWQGFYRVDP